MYGPTAPPTPTPTATATPTSTPRPTATWQLTSTPKPGATSAATPVSTGISPATATPTPLPPPASGYSQTAISYTYDPLGRLTSASYSSGDSFSYTYDAAGNRLTETACVGAGCTPITTTYTYDDANRLATVNGLLYSWDANGNLLSDGATSYSYDAANRLTSTVQGSTTHTFAYNGLGDRLQQTVGGSTTSYTLDLAAPLSQVLAEGSRTYLYGSGRIAQASASSTEYFLTDALGSVRQLTDATGAISLVRAYQPYGSTLSSAGTGLTSYGFAGEYADTTGLIHLRARYYAPGQGRFTTRDTFPGFDTKPFSLHPYQYGYANPVMNIDPSGKVIPVNQCFFFGRDPRTGACRNPGGVAGLFLTAMSTPAVDPASGLAKIALTGCAALATLIVASIAVNTHVANDTRNVTWDQLYDKVQRPTATPIQPVWLATPTPEPNWVVRGAAV